MGDFSPDNSAIKVLSEETFLDEVGKIIERDFFPDMPSLRSQLGDELADIPSRCTSSSLGRMMRSTITPPPPRSVPGSSQRNSGLKSTRPQFGANEARNVSLNQFLDNYTSEENFNLASKLRQDIEQRHRNKFKWLHEQQNALKDSRMNALMFNPPGVLPGQQNLNRLGIRHKNARSIKSFTSVCKESELNLIKPSSGHNSKYHPVRTPTPKPGEITPFITWGEIKSTPLLLPKTPNIFQTPKSNATK